MKKFLSFIFLLSFLIFNTLQAKNTWFRYGGVYSGEVKYYGIKSQLPEGDWELALKWEWSILGIDGRGITLAQLDGTNLVGLYDIAELNGGGKFTGLISNWVYQQVFKNPYDGCYERSEYYYLDFFTKGASFNCLKVRHFDVRKEMFNPDSTTSQEYAWESYQDSTFKHFMRKRNITTPKILIARQHFYFSPLVRDRLILVAHHVNPEYFGQKKTINGNEELTEYHKDNIHKHPAKKKFMDEFVEKAHIKHAEFEKIVKARPHHILRKSDTTIKTKRKIKNKDDDVVEQLKELNQMYQSGVLSKEEFSKAKKKILKNN